MEIDIFGAINDYGDEDWGFSAKTLRKKLEGLKEGDELTVYINSPGGNVFEGLTIYNILAEKKPIIKIVGEASSMASVIACAGKEVMIAESAVMLLHKPWTVAIGNEDDMKKTSKELETLKNSIIAAYRTKTGMSAEEINDLLEQDRYFGAEECLKYGLVDKIYSPTQSESREAAMAFARMQYYAMKIHTKLNTNQLNSQNHGGEMDFEGMKAQRDELQNKVNELTSQFTALNAEISEARAEVKTMKEERNTLTATISELQAKISDYDEKHILNTVKLDIERLRDKILPVENSAENNFELEQELLMLRKMDSNIRINGKHPYDKRIAEIEARKSLKELEELLEIDSDIVSLTDADVTSDEGREAVHSAVLALMKRDNIKDYNTALEIILKENK